MADLASQALTVKFLADTGNLNRGLDGLSGRFRTVTSGLKGIATAGLAVGAISFMKSAIEEAREAAKVLRQTEAVLKSTGGAAKVTASHVDALATRLSNMAGVDDELIASGENLLLTFTRIRNEAGKGNDIFDQATTVALDMSAAMGTDLQGAVVKVGKALNDPIKGMSALSKVGVAFTKEQKDEVAALVKKGDILGAQKIILAELNTEFGGMAAASADAGNKAKVAWDNMLEAIGTRVLPMFSEVAGFITTAVVPAIGSFADKVGNALSPAINKAGEFIKTRLVPAIQNVIVWIRDTLWPVMQRVWNMIVEAIKPVVTAIVTNLIDHALKPLWSLLQNQVGPALMAIVGFFEQHKWIIGLVASAIAGYVIALTAYNVVMGAVNTVTKIATAIQTAFNAVMKANPIMLVVTILGLLVGAFIYAWQNSATFRDIVKGVWEAIKTGIGVAWGVIKGIFNGFMTGIHAIGDGFTWMKDKIVDIWKKIGNIIKKPVQFIIDVVWNNSIRWFINKVASFLGLGNPVGDPIRLAGGGVLGGYAPGRDSVPALLSPGESVLVPELTRAIGPQNILAANRAASGRAPGGGGPGGYAGGGIIGKIADWVGGVGKDVLGVLSDPFGTIVRAMGNNSFVTTIAQAPAKMISKAADWLWKHLQLAGPDVSFANGNVMQGLKQWVGRENLTSKKYEWGAVGPHTYDCSGLVGTMWALATGRQPFRRYMTTATMGPGKYGMSEGRGPFTVLLGPGHTAAELNGTRVEAHGPNGSPLVVGSGGTNASFFNRILHVNFAGGGIAKLKSDPAARIQSWLEGGWPEPYIFDNGGVWKSGTLGVNTSGSDEYVVNPSKNPMGDKHYHFHANVTNRPVELVQQFMRMELLEPGE